MKIQSQNTYHFRICAVSLNFVLSNKSYKLNNQSCSYLVLNKKIDIKNSEQSYSGNSTFKLLYRTLEKKQIIR